MSIIFTMSLFSSCANTNCPLRTFCFRFRQKVTGEHTYIVGIYDNGCDEFLPLRSGDIVRSKENCDEKTNQAGLSEDI